MQGIIVKPEYSPELCVDVLSQNTPHFSLSCHFCLQEATLPCT